MKPKSFFDLPRTLQEDLLGDMDLDYCPYESSQVECIHGIMNGHIYERNKQIIENAYKFMDEDLLVARAKSLCETAANDIKCLEIFMNGG